MNGYHPKTKQSTHFNFPSINYTEVTLYIGVLGGSRRAGELKPSGRPDSDPPAGYLTGSEVDVEALTEGVKLRSAGEQNI